MKKLSIAFLWILMLGGYLLSAQESPYLLHDVTAEYKSARFMNFDIHGDVLKIIESQDYHPNPKHDLNSYFVVDHDKKFSKHIIYTTTPKTTTTFSFDKTGKIISANQTTIEKTFYKKIRTKVVTHVNDQRSTNRRRGIRHSESWPTRQSSQTILNRFTFQDELPILWEQKKEKQDTWQKIEAFRYDSLQRIRSVYHYENNQLEDITTYTYDNSNRIVKEKRVPFVILKKVSPTLHKQYSYDDSLHSTQVTDLLRDSLTYPFTANRRFISQYDSEGRLLMVEGDNLGYYNPYPNRCCSISTPIRKITFKYDDHGALTEKSYYSGDGMTVVFSLTWKYEYDDKGNWVKCKQYEDDHLLYVTKRTIVYR